MKTKTRGLFKQLSDGSWSIDTKVKVNGEYKHFAKRGYRTLSDAKADYDRALNQFIQKNSHVYEVLFFDDVINEYKKMRAVTVNDTTLITDNSIYNVYLYPYFKGKLIKDVFNPTTMKDWYERLAKNRNYSENKKGKVITRTKDILKFAYNHKYIDAETFQDCDVIMYPIKSSKKPKEKTIWTQEEEEKFLSVVKDTSLKDYIMFKTFFSLGARIGEFLAIQGKGFDGNMITINQQIVYTEDGFNLTSKLKTYESYRQVLLDTTTSQLLKQYVKDFNIKDNDFLFYSFKKNEPVSKTTFRRKLNYYCSEANVPIITPHCARHRKAVQLSSVSLSMSDLEIAAKMLGHSPSMFVDTYANHNTEKEQNRLLSRLSK